MAHATHLSSRNDLHVLGITYLGLIIHDKMYHAMCKVTVTDIKCADALTKFLSIFVKKCLVIGSAHMPK